MKRSKRYQEAIKFIDRNKIYKIEEAISLLKKIPRAKFDETVEISCNLGVDYRQSDQMVRGSVVLPHGTGKKIKVLVFCESEKEKDAKEAGADYVGGSELIDKISQENWLEFDYCISTPSMMRLVSRLGKILGPRGLMPSPKTGSVTDNIAYAVSEAKRGKIDFRMDKTGCLHCGIGKVSFPEKSLAENIHSFLEAVYAARPAAAKGDLIKSIFLSTTMSPSLSVEIIRK